MQEQHNIRAAVIGAGNMGSAHISTIGSGKICGMTLAAVCDILPKKLDSCQHLCPDAARFTRWEDVIQSPEVDAVIIAVPHKLHAEIAIAALQGGKHVLTEKPVDVSITRAAALNEAAAHSDRVFGIMFNQRTNPLFQKARQIVTSGQLGELKRSVWIITNWYRTQHYYDSGSWRATWEGEGGGVLLNQAPHNLDLWQWICGMPCEITAFCDIGKYHNIEVEDDVTIFARYANGATGSFITSTGEYPGTNRLEISGSKGKLVLENGTLKWWKLREDERDFCYASEKSFSGIETDYSELQQENAGTAHAGILQNFTNAILHGEPLLAPGAEGIRELTISNAAYLSAWNGSMPIQIPFDGSSFDRQLAAHITEIHKEQTAESDHCNTSYQQRWQTNW